MAQVKPMKRMKTPSNQLMHLYTFEIPSLSLDCKNKHWVGQGRLKMVLQGWKVQ
jgi:hypothetical protein